MPAMRTKCAVSIMVAALAIELCVSCTRSASATSKTSDAWTVETELSARAGADTAAKRGQRLRPRSPLHLGVSQLDFLEKTFERYKAATQKKCESICRHTGGGCEEHNGKVLCVISCRADADCPKDMFGCWCEDHQKCSFAVYSAALPPRLEPVCVEKGLQP